MTVLGNVAIFGLGFLFVLVVAASASSTRHIDMTETPSAKGGGKSGG